MSKMAILKISETELIKQIMGHLNDRGIFAWRNNSGATKFFDYKTGKQSFVRFGKKGSPDIIGILPKTGQFLGIEAKVGKNSLTDAQKDFGEQIEASKGIYWVIRDIDELMWAFENKI